MTQRVSWLDQIKGLGLIIGLLVYFVPLLTIDFKPQNQNPNIFNINLIKNIELFTHMGLIFISALSFKFFDYKNIQWFGKKFINLVLLSTFLYAVGQDYRSIFWQTIQCLWFYFPLFYILNQQKHLGVKAVLWSLILLIYYISLPLWSSLSDSLLGSIFFGFKQHQVSFNIFMGLPMVVLSSILSDLIIKDKKIDTSLSFKVLVGLISLMIVKYFIIKYFIISKNIYGYPPHINEFLSGAIVVLLGIVFSLKFPLNNLINFGKNGLVNYWTLWLFGSLIFEWNQIGMYKFPLFISFSLILLILGFFIGIKNYRSRS
jgi:hypothetical protein